MKRYTTETLSDLDLITHFLDTQSEECFALLYNRYAHKIYRKCISLLKNEILAKDAAQDIFLKILLNLPHFNRQSRFSTWVYSITYNYCIDFLRRKKREKMVSADEDRTLTAEVPEERSDNALLELELNRLVEVLDRLPTPDKNILLMKYKEGWSIREIGDTLDKSESAIKMRLKRAKLKAQKVYRTTYQEEFA